jgi:putative phosphoesterase
MTMRRISQTCEVNQSYCKFGSETLLKRLEGFEDLVDGIEKNVDIECVHKTRVTSRRIRAAMPLFSVCFPQKKFRRWTKEIKKVTRLLATARDLDVQIVFIKQYMAKLNSAPEKACMNVLLKDQKNCRKNVQSSVVDGLDELFVTHILEDMRCSCQEIIDDTARVPFKPQPVLEKAHWSISFRLDDFLGMEKYVLMENEKLKHHEMRMYAKKLRYTMEVFAPLYNDKLAEEIDNIKNFQDVLGEMHDCDVWMDYILKFVEKQKNKIAAKKTDLAKLEQALDNFLTLLSQKRKENYSQFVHLWQQNKENEFFSRLRKKTSECLVMVINDRKIQQALSNPKVKVAVLSDIHANLYALECVLQDAEKRGATIFLNAGDSIGFGPCPNEVVELLSEKGVVSVLGNYDLEVIEGKSKDKGEKKLALKFANKELTKSCECYLYSLPHELRLEVGGKKLLVTHGSPESIEEHIYPDTPIERLSTLADTAKADIIVVGHSHEQLNRKVNEVFFVNPGSVGRPGDGNPKTGYAILSFNPFKAELIRLDYDVAASADALRKKGLPESFSQMLLRGVALDAIVEDDKAKENCMLTNCTEMVQASEKVASKYWQDTEHFAQVTKLALELFDRLVNVHKLSIRERCWLECAALLHDIGLSVSRIGHHKISSTLILNETQLPFPSLDRGIIASIARYHRKALPKQSHSNLTALDPTSIQKVKILSSLLRIADSLDYTHQCGVKSLNVKVGTKKVTIECETEIEDTALEEQAFNKKKDLFERVFAKKLVLVWKKQ